MTPRTCLRPRCGRPETSRGLCWTHYRATRPERVDATPLRAELAEWQESAGISVRTMSTVLGVPRATLGAILGGSRPTVTRATARAIVKALAVARAGDADDVRGPLVPSFPSTRRLRALRAAGVSEATIVAATGVHRATISRLTWRPAPTTSAATDAAIASAFARLGAQPVARPPEHVAEMCWPVPIEWDDDAIVDKAGRHHAHGHTRSWRLREYRAGTWPAPISDRTRRAAEHAARGALVPEYAARLRATQAV